MNLFFWQNIVSHIQIPYIKELSKNNDVTLIVPVALSNHRKNMGWTIPDLGNIKLIVSPDVETINSLMTKPNGYHFFSGISAFPFVYKAFKISLKYNVYRGIISEAPFTFRRPLMFHYIKTLINDYRYFSKIHYVFAIGEFSYKWYSMWSKKWKVFEFTYVVEPPNYSNNIKKDTIFRFVYVGSLIPRKNVDIVVKALKEVNISYNFDIIGNGEQYAKLNSMITKYNLQDKIKLLGTVNNKDIRESLTNYDCLILPSKHDGWGAVVNEAIMAGCYVICSDKCGAKALLHNSNKIGLVFKSNSTNKLKEVINKVLNKKEYIRQHRQYRNRWSENISAERISSYFQECLDSDNYVNPPWKTKFE